MSPSDPGHATSEALTRDSFFRQMIRDLSGALEQIVG